MTKYQIARQEVEAAFENFVKWETYGTAFDHMDAKHIRLTDIVEIAGRVAGISEGVIRMRRRDWNGMRITEGSSAWNRIHSDKNKHLPYSPSVSILPPSVNEDDYQELLGTGLIYGKHGDKLFIVGRQ